MENQPPAGGNAPEEPEGKVAIKYNVVPDFTPQERTLLGLFYPHMLERYDALGPDGRLVHYCAAETDMNILSGNEVWLRNTTTMNDFTEVEHGLQLLAEPYRSDEGKRFQAAIDKVHPGLSQTVATHFDKFQHALKFNSYVLSLSEHDDKEDLLGRLSMWRAYGRGTGIALVRCSFGTL